MDLAAGLKTFCINQTKCINKSLSHQLTATFHSYLGAEVSSPSEHLYGRKNSKYNVRLVKHLTQYEDEIVQTKG